MSREAGFVVADIAVALLDDPKVRRLVRSTKDEPTIARCLVGYLATLLTSWSQGERVVLEDAAPIWLTAADDLTVRLVAVELLDADGRLPEQAWNAWFGPAWRRREERREAGRKGGLAKAAGVGVVAESEQSPSSARAEPGHRSSVALPDPTVPTEPTDPGRTDRSPQPPTRGGRGSRANGTNPRQVAVRAQERRAIDQTRRELAALTSIESPDGPLPRPAALGGTVG